MSENTNHSTKKYIVTNEQGEEFLLPKYAATFRILMDDKDTIRDVLNSLLQLDHDHEIIDLEYEFEKPIDIFMPENDPARLDVWVHTRDNRYLNIEMQNKRQPFDTARCRGQRRKQVVANHKRDHRNHDVHRPGHFNER